MGLYPYVSNQPLVHHDPMGRAQCKAHDCKDLRQDPNHPSGSNGCGAGILVPLIPDKPFGIPVVDGCDVHDFAYSICQIDEILQDGGLADDQFCDCLYDLCESEFPNSSLRRLLCKLVVSAYCNAVQIFGPTFYCDAQETACICCDPPAPDAGCWGNI